VRGESPSKEVKVLPTHGQSANRWSSRFQPKDAEVIEEKGVHMSNLLGEEAWGICASILLVCLGIALIGYGRWQNLDISNGWPVYPAGSIFCLAGMHYLGSEDPSREPAYNKDPQLGSKYVCLGRLALNGHSIRAYEIETDQGNKRFRLVSIPAVTHEKEAALIRYIVNEGLMENISQGMSEKIEEEAA
jgi:hypothetical protein